MEHGEAADQPPAHPGDAEATEETAAETNSPPVGADDTARAMPEPPETGDARVDDAVRPLGDLGDRSPGEHVEAYEQVHAGLQETLADIDTRAEDDREGG